MVKRALEDVTAGESNGSRAATVRAGQLEIVLAEGHPEISLEALKGVGTKTAARLRERGIADQRDLLLLLPRRYKRLLRNAGGSELRQNEPENASFCAVVVSVSKPRKWGRGPLEVVVEVDGVRLVLVWFNMRAERFIRAFRAGRWVEVEGTIDWSRSLPRITHPVIGWTDGEAPRRRCRFGFDPIYPGMDGVAPRVLRSAVEQAFEALGSHIVEVVPPDLLARTGLPAVCDALATLHLIEDYDDVTEFETELDRSRDRLVYEEFYTLQARLAADQVELRGRARAPTLSQRELGRDFVRALPFELTADQRAVAGVLAEELGRRVPMRRLLQGDVGSGKTVVALMAATIAAGSRFQAALMAPTEVLAAQHYERARTMFGDLGVEFAYVGGAMPAAERRASLRSLRSGIASIAIGTHSLFSDDVEYARLGLVIVDEQHKFGVEQREALLAKGRDPHLLAMTATPIPRSLAHAVFGDLELAVLREKPPGREPVRTYLRDRRAAAKVYKWLREVIGAGHQAYVVYPAIDRDARGFQSLLSGAEELANGPLRGARVGVLHGRMSSEDKLSIMRRFERGEVDVLCSTTVIEVGVDVANATVMVIESPEAFGLSQLHQLRGRVGRGDETSRCILLRGENVSQDALDRLQSFTATTDGFELAEIDLLMRGPGEFLGVRQAGAAEFRFADLIRDREWLEIARRDARHRVLGDIASNP